MTFFNTGRAIVAAVASLVVAFSASATAASKKTATGNATLTIFRPIALQKTTDLSFGRFQNEGGKVAGTVTVTSAPPVTVSSNGVQIVGGGTPSAAAFSITGDPNRAYTASVATSVVSNPGGYVLSQFTFWSKNSGNITGHAGNFSASGTDTVSVGATVTVPPKAPTAAYGAVIPLTISYQ